MRPLPNLTPNRPIPAPLTPHDHYETPGTHALSPRPLPNLTPNRPIPAPLTPHSHYETPGTPALSPPPAPPRVSKSSNPSAGSPPPMANRLPGQGAAGASNSIPLAGRPVLSISGGQSASTSGSVGSPSMDPAPMTTPASESTFVRLNDLDIQGDEAGSSLGGGVSGKKKKRGARAVAGDKTGRGLRQFSMKVCEKVESKGRTTYNEVADELVAEFADPGSSLASPDQQQYDEKNIRRRVYDALNVLMAMDIISKDKKEIQWKGLPRTSQNDIEELKGIHIGLKGRIEKKAAYMQELEDQFVGLQNLIQRNERLYGSGNVPSGGVTLPFILVQTRPHATVEVEISEDMQLVHFDFNSTPFELHDDSYVLKAMRFCGREQNEGADEPVPRLGETSNTLSVYQQQQVPHSYTTGRPPASPPLPGILKAPRMKHER